MLSKLLDVIEQTPVSIEFLKKRVSSNVRVLHYSELKNFNRSKLFTGFVAVIVLIPHRKLKKGHFVCLTPQKKHVEYFSSLGMSPHDELVKLKHEDNFMSSILGTNFTYNRVRLQNQGDYSINTCGGFVFARAIFHKLKLREFLELFKNIQLRSADEIVSALVLLHFVDM